MKKIAGLILVLLAFGAGFLYWLSQSDWLESFNDEQNTFFTELSRDGARFGENADQQQCLDETLARFDGCQAFRCTVGYGKFLKACLGNARPLASFCEGVPEFREEPTEKDKEWAKFFCVDRNVRGEGCRLLMRQQQMFCSQQ